MTDILLFFTTKKYPQYYYSGPFNPTSMIVEFSDWENKISQKQIERSEKIKQFSDSLLSGNGLFKAMNDIIKQVTVNAATGDNAEDDGTGDMESSTCEDMGSSVVGESGTDSLFHL